MPNSECDHIVGSDELIEGDWLLFKSDERTKIDRAFSYCPLCGASLERLKESEDYEEMIHG